MTTIAFVDTETTHLDAEIGEVWEVAVILREQDGQEVTDTEYVWEFSINPETVDPEALRVGRWYERRQLPARTDRAAFTGSVPAVHMSRTDAVKAIVSLLSGAVLIGSNPGFDDRHLRRLVGPGGAQWHYRPYDIVQLAAAKIGPQAAGPLPWRTHVLSRAVGVEPPATDVAHTALGDARWARDVYDTVMTPEKYPLSWEGRAQHAIGLYTQTAIELEDARRELAKWEAAAALDSADETPCTCTVGDACDQCADDDQEDEDLEEETGDADGDVFELISEIAARLRDATDSGEYHAVGLIYDLANGRTTIADARAELADIEFGHV